MSQSFIHQVRILSPLREVSNTSRRISRNPLFIKSEFSQGGSNEDGHRCKSRNPLFIKSEFSRACLAVFKNFTRPAWAVAILYSSSQNSLRETDSHGRCTHIRMSQSFIHQVRILSRNGYIFIATPQTMRVAILYSSSQNSLMGSASEREIRLSVKSRRNPLFIKSEFSLGGEQHLDDNSILDGSQSFIHQVRILSSES